MFTGMPARLALAVLCAAVILVVPAHAADAPDAGFGSFYSSFRDAVGRRDETALRKLMAADLDFIRAQNVPWDKVFQGLAADQGRQWANLQQAVQQQPSPFQERGQQQPTRLVRCTPTDIIYNCLVVFTQDADGGWRWQGMIMPTRVRLPEDSK